MQINVNNLPVFAEFDEVPYVVYDDPQRGAIAINDFSNESTLLPEILFEGEEISRERFTELAANRGKGSTKYKEVLDFYDKQKS